MCIQQYFLSINANKMYYRINSPWLINVVLYLFTTRNAEEDFIHNSLTDMGLITTFFAICIKIANARIVLILVLGSTQLR